MCIFLSSAAPASSGELSYAYCMKIGPQAGPYKLLIENLVRSRRKWQETWQALVLFMLYLALGTYEWQLCSTLQRFTSCASAVSAIIERHVLLYELKERKEHLYSESHILCFSSR